MTIWGCIIGPRSSTRPSSHVRLIRRIVAAASSRPDSSGMLGRPPYGGEKDRALAARMGTEELHHLVIIKRQAGRAKPQRVRGQIHLSAQNSGLQLSRAIGPIAEAAE